MPTERAAGSLSAALEASPAEGVRRLALHWLRGLQEARARWDALAVDDTGATDPDTDGERREALHKARVALRRLRSVAREYDDVLELGSRLDRRLRSLNRATNAVRDSDVQRAWLEAERDSLSAAARADADRLLALLATDVDGGVAVVSAAFARDFDRIERKLQRRVTKWRVTCRIEGDEVVEDAVAERFAELLADRVRDGGATIAAELGALCDEARRWRSEGGRVLAGEMQEAMHELRIRLKRQRALLAAFSSVAPEVAAWYDMATRGQDLLGALRDASNLAALAHTHDLIALATSLEAVAIGHAQTFATDWCVEESAARVRELSERAAMAFEAWSPAAPPSRGDAGSPPLEIERKFLLRDVPPHATRTPPVRIEQGWLPGELLRERLRRTELASGEREHTRTVKFGALGARVELEEPCDPALFEVLWPFTDGARISKLRHRIAEGAFTWEIDVFLDRALVLAEVELEAGQSPPPFPAWLAPFVVRDVTEEPAFTNSAMARAGGVPDAAATVAPA